MTAGKNNKQRILVDLKIAMNNGYCGIAKENRMVFKMLAHSGEVEASGLLMSRNPSSVFYNYKQPRSAIAAVEQANRFFHDAFSHELLIKARILKSLSLAKFMALKNKKFDLYAIDPIYRDVIWRNVFDKSLGAEDKELLLEKQFHYTNMTSFHEGINAYFKRRIHLDTRGYDYAIFLEPAAISVSPGTTKIVRYHDAIPVTEPDFSGGVYSYRTLNTLALCADDSYFVCNSEPTREALLKLRPDLEAKALTIPVSLPSVYKKVNNEETLKQVIAARLSSRLISTEKTAEIRRKILASSSLNYIFNLAALDPKKNHITLIKAWEKLNYRYPQGIKLIISANSGWLSKEIEDMMRPHVEMGNIIHVNNLSVDDVPYLFSHAKAFVFPSYTEGFGLPPLEAMQCECPTIVSDIPAHRWVMGDASLYCNPYSSDSLADVMAQLLYHEGAEGLQQELAKKGLERVKRYSEGKLAGEWVQLFDRIKSLKS